MPLQAALFAEHQLLTDASIPAGRLWAGSARMARCAEPLHDWPRILVCQRRVMIITDAAGARLGGEKSGQVLRAHPPQLMPSNQAANPTS